ncbi:RRP15-like protein [Leuresthes tenuis]|uniref:RRP15-like protein n=1 Tax=Leuresthes tenuis TaxID=355514 RepID=UPI003B5106F4
MALGETHVLTHLAEDTVPQLDDSHEQRDSDGGSSDGGENHRDSDGWSDREREEVADGGDDTTTVVGWAEAMAKILGKKTTESRSNILVKSKELDKMKAADREEQLKRKKQMDKKRTWEIMCREKPEIVKDRETEKALQRIATRGVVQLFNAVRKHQKTVDDKVRAVGGSERKKAKILSSFSKKDFISVLKREEGVNKTSAMTESDVAPAAEEKPAWSVLRDDFMMEATMKDWDKDSDREEADPHTGGRLESSDSD